MSPSSSAEGVNGASACACVVDLITVSLFSEDPELEFGAPVETENAEVEVESDDEREDPSCFPSSEELRLLEFTPGKKGLVTGNYEPARHTTGSTGQSNPPPYRYPGPGLTGTAIQKRGRKNWQKPNLTSIQTLHPALSPRAVLRTA